MHQNTLYILFIFLPLISFAQNNRYEEPYPAPVSYANLSEKKSKFLALFEDRNVGNLHLFTNRRLEKFRTFKGVVIPKSYKYYFPTEVWKTFRKKRMRPRALYSIRGDAEEWYIIRISDKNRKNSLRLFEWRGNRLIEKMLLADVTCRGADCEQIDSWIRDLDGDTNLDIVQRRANTNKDGKVLSSTITAYAIDREGKFVENKQLRFDPNDYQMESVKY